MRYGDSESVADTHAETNHQKVDGTGRAYRCQVVYSQKPSYDHRIHQIVKLLK